MVDQPKDPYITFYMREQLPNYWEIYSHKGSLISGPHIFGSIITAADWGTNFISSWVGARIILCIKKDREKVHGSYFKSIKKNHGPEIRVE